MPDELPPPNTQSMVPNLGVTTTEVDQILAGIAGRDALPSGLPAPSIRQTPIDEVAGNERIFAIAFPTLYPTGAADFNIPRVRFSLEGLSTQYPVSHRKVHGRQSESTAITQSHFYKERFSGASRLA
ncbi:ATP-dependent DNA helicase PIF1 [Sclerotinia borealis F-4128]|uniref:ATP-dependent DNA helicase PIF1 n=1 Tax=Sclerotinia borealis (strain F-4128) TaxID=1432307 RepID=W9C8E7_SCLBF|nr:ATP-dependent DNA helicase PIF1 [Sclerotinia borealis F-4128]